MIKVFQFFFIALLAFPYLLHAEESRIDEEVDTIKAIEDSGYGAKKGNIIIVPIPVLNPTIGTGIQPVMLYLHPKKEGEENTPNATTGAGGMYTDSKSWVVALFHDNYLFQDRLRVRAAIGTAELHIKYFGSGSDPIFADNPVEYKLSSDIYFAQGLGRLPWTSNFYAGLRATVLKAEVAFDFASLIPGLPEVAVDTDIVSLAVVLNRDSRDDNYYPTSGNFIEMAFERNDESWGSDYNFDKHSFEYNHYFSLNSKNIIAVRAHANQINGDAPFFLLPSLDMRGFASGRHQDNSTLSTHMEWRHKFLPRWGLMFSLEAGRVANSINEMGDSQTISSAGAGIRWQVTADKPIHLGLDVGVSGSDKAFSITIGEKF